MASFSRHTFFPLRSCGRRRSTRSAAGGTVQLQIERLDHRLLRSTFTVTSLDDTGSGFGLQGDLRYAINTANVNLDLTNRIVFRAGLTGTITLSQGNLPIKKNLEIDGPGADLLTVSGALQSGVFNITSDAAAQVVRLADLTIADGTGVVDPFNRIEGGGLYNDHAAVTLIRCVFTGNMLPANALGDGGAIYNAGGSLELDACTVSGNSAGDSTLTANRGGGIFSGGSQPVILRNVELSGNTGFEGAAIDSTGPLTMLDSHVADNIAVRGGSISIFPFTGSTTIRDSTVEHNRGTQPAAGLRTSQIIDSTIADNVVGGVQGSGLTISGTTISGNTALANSGTGGVTITGGDNHFTNCTISGNTGHLTGGGLAYTSVDAIVEMTNCTITGNVVPDATGLQGGGGIWVARSSTAARFVIHNTIVAGNSSTGQGPDVLGAIISFGYNLIGQTDNSSGWVNTDRTGTSATPLDPLLSPLQDNGGPTLTHALAPNSLAINAGDPSASETYDQRGTMRDGLGHYDIGAFQTQEVARFRVLAPSVVTAGEAFAVTVIALDNWGNRVPYVDNLHFSSSDFNAQLPDDYTYQVDDWGVHTFLVSLNSPGSQFIKVNDEFFPYTMGSATVNVRGGANDSGSPVRISLGWFADDRSSFSSFSGGTARRHREP
jgi:hypothetical protein